MFKLIKLTFSGALAVVFIAACSYSVKNVPASYKLNDKAGLAVVSLTVSDECAQGKGHGYAYFTEIREINTRKAYSIAMQGFGSERDWEREEKDCSTDRGNYYGRLVAIELPAGAYEIYQIEGIAEHRKTYSKNKISVTFMIEPENINYIGNMHYHISKKKIIYDVENMSDRDMDYFYKKYPKFNEQDFVTNLLNVEKID
ncbi:MAG TPA: hypothetical protein ENJ08_09345 [Gammaproteobacteria bacterium]|nr:hypothetical protein [Gammaproteobacteria bacterium]